MFSTNNYSMNGKTIRSGSESLGSGFRIDTKLCNLQVMLWAQFSNFQNEGPGYTIFSCTFEFYDWSYHTTKRKVVLFIQQFVLSALGLCNSESLSLGYLQPLPLWFFKFFSRLIFTRGNLSFVLLTSTEQCAYIFWIMELLPKEHAAFLCFCRYLSQ